MGFSTFSQSTTFFVFAKDMPWDGFVNIPGGLVKTQWGSHHLDDEYHINVKCKSWAMNHEHHSVDATRFVAAQWFCVGITCRNYPIMQKHFENHDIIVQKKEIGPGWVRAFIVLTDSNGKLYVWRFLLGKRWPSSMELMQLLWLWKIQPSKTWDASHDLLIKYVTVLRAFLRRSHTLVSQRCLYSQTDRKQPHKSVILGEPFQGFLAHLPKFRELKIHQSKPTKTGSLAAIDLA